MWRPSAGAGCLNRTTAPCCLSRGASLILAAHARGPADTIEHLAQRVSHDLAYIKNWSLLFDLQILIKTAFKVLNDRNAR